MTENKRFCKGYYSPEWYTVCEIEKDEEVICTVALKDADFIIKIFEKNEKLKEENKQLKQTIDCICKDYENYTGMDIRNAEWFTAW